MKTPNENTGSGIDTGKKTTRGSLTKIAGVACLYRHENGRYYAVKKHRGKIKSHVLRTKAGDPVTDRKIAESALRVWIDRLEANQSPEDASLTLRVLIERYIKTKAGCSGSTRENVAWMAGRFGYVVETRERKNNRGGNRKNIHPSVWHRGLDVRVTDIRPSDLSTFLGKLSYLKPLSFNTLGEYIRQLFALAVADKIVDESPFQAAANKRKKVRREPRPTPADEQFEKIVAFIRNQRFTDHNEDSADLAEFLGLAGLGEAEAAQFHWRDFDLNKPTFKVKRFKTQTWFEVPIYPKLRKYLEALYVRQGSPGPDAKVFRVGSAKRALETACKELNYPHFSPRALRRRAIVEQLRAGVNVKLVSKWQGHQDGGKLILNTYSEIISEGDRNFELAELAKLPS
ncbi:MAG TPA: site-specific integrase [Chthoniobacteraceae bacterium]|nr:site-specific integrase [Chthoniobacteraceae bacterium]